MTAVRRPSPQQHPQSSGRRRPTCYDIACCNRQRHLPVRQAEIRRLLQAALRQLGVPAADLSVAIVADAEIAAVHNRWLGVPEPTDVISFDLSGGPGDAGLGGRPGGDPRQLRLVGEIIASAETAARQAARYGWQADHELAYYLVHGLLHLCGFDDLAPGPRRSMRRRERQLMLALGLPAPPRRSGRRAAPPATPPRKR